MDIDKSILKFTQKDRRPRITNRTLKMNKVGRETLLDFRIYCKATDSVTWNRITSPEMDAHE